MERIVGITVGITIGITGLALLVSCYSEADFDEEYDLAICEKIFECSDDSVLPFLPYEDVDACVAYRSDDAAEDDPEEDCKFSGSAAQGCVEQTVDLGCDAYEDGEFPAVCAQVCEPVDD